jgi:hypothetical protein
VVIDFVVCEVGTSMLIFILTILLLEEQEIEPLELLKMLLSDTREHKYGHECNYAILSINSRWK